MRRVLARAPGRLRPARRRRRLHIESGQGATTSRSPGHARPDPTCRRRRRRWRARRSACDQRIGLHSNCTAMPGRAQMRTRRVSHFRDQGKSCCMVRLALHSGDRASPGRVPPAGVRHVWCRSRDHEGRRHQRLPGTRRAQAVHRPEPGPLASATIADPWSIGPPQARCACPPIGRCARGRRRSDVVSRASTRAPLPARST